ncbi:MAG: BatD family protein [Candidatus Omnitrophica bacterium]|nr:BatD family protein [Candidatus Omnitrophota bacterium]MCM8790435.1 BatD family protein [Candidatus Omnitrophota bacterium]
MRILFTALLALTLMATGASAKDEQPALRQSVDRHSAFIGDRIRYAIEITSGKNSEAEFPVFKDNALGDFEIKDSGASVKKRFLSRRTLNRWYSIAAYSTGKKTIPEVEIKYRPKGDKEWTTLKTKPIDITIVSVLPKGAPARDIKDIKGPLSFKEINLFVVIGTSILILAACTAAIIYRKMRKRAPLRLPHETALEELEAIKAAFLQGGDVKEYFIGVSDCVRRYIERVFSVKAPEMTTEEFLNSLRVSSVLSLAHKELLRGFLNACDLVKFAKYAPTRNEAENIYLTAKSFIEETRDVYSQSMAS